MTFQEFQESKFPVEDIGGELVQGRDYKHPDDMEPLLESPGLIYTGPDGRKYWIEDTGEDACRYRTRLGLEYFESSDLHAVEAELHAQIVAPGRMQ